MTLVMCRWYCGRGWPVQVNQRMLCSNKREATLLKLLGKVSEQTVPAMCVYIHIGLLCHKAQALLKREKPAMAPQCQPTEIQMHFMPREHNPYKEN